MYMTNEGWEQNNQDYLKESYEKTGFTAGGYAVRKLICGGCGRIFYTTIETTCPEETIYQLGTLDEHASAEDLLNIVTEFIDEFKSRFGDHVHVLN